MALRAKESDVRDVVDLDVTVNLLPFLRAANRLVDYVVTQDADGLLTTGMLRDVETFLAAHFAVHNRDHQYNSKSTGGASGSFTGQFAMRLESTSPGQTAMLLDLTGTLKQLNEARRPQIQVSWLGKRPSEQTNYVDRD
jgi:hypothetical protein